MVLMANRYILPAALSYQTVLAQSVTAGRAAGVPSAETKKLLTEFTRTIDGFRKSTDKLEAALEHGGASAEKHAKYMRDTIVPNMVALRELGDRIETTVPSATWPLPTYREMLFIK
jgi:glutamine synthetase